VKVLFFHRVHHTGVLFVICQLIGLWGSSIQDASSEGKKETPNPQATAGPIAAKLNPADGD